MSAPYYTWSSRDVVLLLGCDQDGSIGKHVAGITFHNIWTGQKVTELFDYAPPGKHALKFGDTVKIFDSPDAAYQYVVALEELRC